MTSPIVSEKQRSG